jgi:hypothetical protein
MTDEHPGCVSRREFELWCAYHAREHHIHSEAHDREHEFMLASLSKSDAVLEKRLEGMNEFREALKDQSASFVTRDVADIQHSAFTKRIDDIIDRVGAAERWESGINGRTIGVSAAVGIAVVIFTIIMKFIP